MRRNRTTFVAGSIAATFAALILCGCGTAHTAAKPTGSPSPSAPSAASPHGVTWSVWHLVSSSPKSATITVAFDNDLKPEPPCSIPTKAVARENATTVAIGLVTAIPGPACIEPGIRKIFTIHLKKPLGARKIVAITPQYRDAGSVAAVVRMTRCHTTPSVTIHLVAGFSPQLSCDQGDIYILSRQRQTQFERIFNPTANTLEPTLEGNGFILSCHRTSWCYAAQKLLGGTLIAGSPIDG